MEKQSAISVPFGAAAWQILRSAGRYSLKVNSDPELNHGMKRVQWLCQIKWEARIHPMIALISLAGFHDQSRPFLF